MNPHGEVILTSVTVAEVKPPRVTVPLYWKVTESRLEELGAQFVPSVQEEVTHYVHVT
jgi:hypothetical protein